jgi:hypothetical protein
MFSAKVRMTKYCRVTQAGGLVVYRSRIRTVVKIRRHIISENIVNCNNKIYDCTMSCWKVKLRQTSCKPKQG